MTGHAITAEGFITGWNEWLSAWDAFVIEIEEILELEDGEHGLIFSVRDGKLLRFEQYLDRSEALDAPGVTFRENKAP